MYKKTPKSCKSYTFVVVGIIRACGLRLVSASLIEIWNLQKSSKIHVHGLLFETPDGLLVVTRLISDAQIKQKLENLTNKKLKSIEDQKLKKLLCPKTDKKIYSISNNLDVCEELVYKNYHVNFNTVLTNYW